jgi:hypothetical protein
MIGRLYVTHDVGKAGASAVKDALSSYQDNIVINHLHRISYMVEGNAKGVPHVAACFGWLGDVRQVDYMFRVKANRDWALGFGDALSSYQDNIVINHLHRISYMVEGNAKGVPHVAACFGWLGDVRQVDYMFRVKANRDWALGFGVGYVRDNGFVYLQPVPIVENSCCVEGKLFTL